MLTIKISFHIYLLFMFELMTASGAKTMIILKKVSLFYTNLVHFRLISGVTTHLTFYKESKTTDVDCGLGLKQKLGIIKARNKNNAVINSHSTFLTKCN